jgi:hypothetical protein
MATHSQSDLQFEIGHVLFIDIVGYSKLLIDEQTERIRELKEIVRGTEQFRLAEAEGKLLRLPTGDGGALVFRNTQEAPVLCALEISKALKHYPELQVRMGIHSGPVNEVADLNEQMNVAGGWYQHRPARDGLWGCWAHSSLKTCSGRLGRVSAMATPVT